MAKFNLIFDLCQNNRSRKHSFGKPLHSFFSACRLKFCLSHTVRVPRVCICCEAARKITHEATMKRNLFSPCFLSGIFGFQEMPGKISDEEDVSGLHLVL